MKINSSKALLKMACGPWGGGEAMHPHIPPGSAPAVAYTYL